MGNFKCPKCERKFSYFEQLQDHKCKANFDVIEPIQDNPILAEVQALLNHQTEKGLKKYGTTVNVDDYTLVEWIDHVLEEKADEIIYLVTLKHKIKKMLG